MPRPLVPKDGTSFRGQGRLDHGRPRGIYDAIREPPTRVPYEKPSTGSLFYLPAFAGGEQDLGALPLLACRLGQALNGAHWAPAPLQAF